ncbi:glycosyltransferase family 4 protein [Vogesella sp. GCM10023246]|uniref:Glycosyltransferase family 1 protein n=1 Tax=Vogesella oryzagri TaxID=3160864 RepID=A0ABV1M0A6_9NEIS
MRIMIVSDAWLPQVNGVVRSLLETVRELRASGHQVALITPLGGEHDAGDGFRTLPLPSYPDIRIALFPYRQVAQRLAAFSPQAVHIATEGPLGWAARRWCLRHGQPFSTAYHTRFPEYVAARIRLPLAISYAFMRRFHAPAAAVMAPTPSIVRALRQRGFGNVVLWGRGVDTTLFSPGERERLDSAPPRFVYIGRVAVEKNIEAFLQLELPGSKWVVGEGPQLEELRQRYPAVHFAGVFPQHELARFYRAADVFVFPSLTDTFGLVLLEAMACGTPVAAYPVAGPLDVAGDSGGGVLHQDLRSACLQALALDRQQVRQVAERFSWAAATQQFEAHLHPRPLGEQEGMAFTAGGGR